MAARIDPAQVRHISKLARLSLSDDEVVRFSEQLTAVLAYVEQLAQVNTDTVEPLYHPLELSGVARADEPYAQHSDGFAIDDALRNAPDLHGRCFRVPGVFDESN